MVTALLRMLCFVVWPLGSLYVLAMSLEMEDRAVAKDCAALFILTGICIIEIGLGRQMSSSDLWWKNFFAEVVIVHYFTGAVFYVKLTYGTARKWFP